MNITFVLLISCLINIIEMKTRYVSDFLEVEWNATNKNVFDAEIYISRPRRGVSGISGFLDFKRDINADNVRVWFDMYYSPDGVSYKWTPFRSPPITLTEYFNVIYKQFVMNSLKNCSENYPIVEDTFDPPILTKRKIILTDCLPDTDDMIPHMRLGYYKILAYAEGETDFCLVLLMDLDEEQY